MKIYLFVGNIESTKNAMIELKNAFNLNLGPTCDKILTGILMHVLH